MNTSELPQVTEAIIVDDADRYMNLVHENESMLKQLQANQVSMQMMMGELADRRKENEAYRKEVDRLLEENLKICARYEDAKTTCQLVTQSFKESISRQAERAAIMYGFICTWLDEFEIHFERGPEDFNVTIATDYAQQARWAEENYGRVPRMIEEVQDRFNIYVPKKPASSVFDFFKGIKFQ